MNRPCRALGAALLVLGACDGSASDQSALVVYNAGSLALPMRTALASFAAGRDVRIEQESAGSLETARKLTELGKIPDVIALADHEVFPALLVPRYTRWYVPFARNRMVVAYTPKSRHADRITADNWWEILTRDDVEVGRSDPNMDPNGYRTLLVLQLAERHYRRPGLAEGVLARSPTRNVRPKEADLVALLEAGELDYIWSYESMARAARLPYVRLPDAIDLSDPADSAAYAAVSVRVLGAERGDTLTMRGAPIVYAFSIPAEAPHPEMAAEFARYLLSDEGKRVLRGVHLDALDDPAIIGRGAPAAVRQAAGGTAAP